MEIKPGQIWKENDPRFPNSYKKIVQVGEQDVQIITCTAEGGKVPRCGNRWAKRERFDGRAMGYSFFKAGE